MMDGSRWSQWNVSPYPPLHGLTTAKVSFKVVGKAANDWNPSTLEAFRRTSRSYVAAFPQRLNSNSLPVLPPQTDGGGRLNQSGGARGSEGRDTCRITAPLAHSSDQMYLQQVVGCFFIETWIHSKFCSWGWIGNSESFQWEPVLSARLTKNQTSF